jgi:hypothetical protein
MGQVVLNIDGLTFLEQIGKSADVIAKSTNNAQVAGNADELAALVVTHAAFVAANTACEAAKTAAKAKTAERKAAANAWKADLKLLAAKTESLTGGEPAAVLSTGFELKSDPTPTQPLEAPQGVRVATNGTPGKTKLAWEPLAGAVSHVVEGCPDPVTEEGWEQLATPTKSSCTVDGAEPGKKHWFRIAGVNTIGQGPWSDPVCRPVM